jgi:putative membrane protein
MPQTPRAYRLDPGPADRPGVELADEPFDAIEAADRVEVPMPRRRGPPWGGILLSALGGLLVLGIGLGIEQLVLELYAAAPWLGIVALVLVALALVAFLALVTRELAGLWREQRIEALRQRAIDAAAVRDHEAAKAVVADLVALYGARDSASAGRGRVAALSGEIIDAEDRLAIAERELLADLDAQAKRAIAQAAKQVSVVTAVSPRAIVDVAFVIFAAVRLLKRVAAIYGGRPGALGFWRLARAAFNHLAVTGGVAVGDGLLQQALGLGLAARISAKLGEGVLNGLMTARFGLAAVAVCRPLPFLREPPPRLSEVAGELLASAPDAGASGQGRI